MRTKILNFILLLLLTVPTILFTQPLSEVTIYGVVTDSISGEPLEGVLVEAINESDTTERAWGVSDSDGNYVINLVTSLEELQDKGQLPSEFRLFQNYPNPFNPSTIIQFEVPKSSDVQLIIYNTLGQKIRTLVNKQLPRDSYTIEWDGTSEAGHGVAAGIYFYQLRANDYVETRKMVLLDGSVGGSSSRSSGSLRREALLGKPVNLTVTIRASSPYIKPFEQQQVSVSPPSTHLDLSVTCLPRLFNLNNILVSELNDDGSVYIGGLPGAVPQGIDSTEQVVVTNHRLDANIFTGVNPNGSFAAMRLRSKVGDSLSMTLYHDGKPISAPEDLIVPETISPVVLDSKPTNGDKDIIIDAVVKAYFSEPIETASVNNNSFYITDSLGNLVPATIGFLEGNTIALLDPTDSLAYFSSYTITVTTDVVDLQGLSLGNPYSAIFYTEKSIRITPDFQVNETGGINNEYRMSSSISLNLVYSNYEYLMIVWTDSRNGNDDIYAQYFDREGIPIGNNFKVNDDLGNAEQWNPSVSTDSCYHFVIVWRDARIGNDDIYAQLFDLGGSPIGSNFKVNDDLGIETQGSPSVSVNYNGDFVITWMDKRNNGYGDIYAQRYASNGSPLGTNFQVNDMDQGIQSQGDPSISMDNNGDFVITWTDTNNVSGFYIDIYAQPYNASGYPLGNNFKVNDDAGIESVPHGVPSVSMDNNGAFVIVWEDWRNQNGDIYAQRYNQLAPMGTNFRVNDDQGSLNQYNPSISMDSEGSFVIVWDTGGIFDEGDIYAQYFSGDGSPLDDNFLVTDTRLGDQSVPDVTFWNGRIYNTWTDNRPGGTVYNIWTNILEWVK